MPFSLTHVINVTRLAIVKSVSALLLSGLMVAFVTAPAYARKAGDGRQKLEKYLLEFRTLKANFEQVVSNEKGAPLETAKGVVYLNRPGRFRWDYEKPFAQSIVADGVKVWIYDKDLQQVTVKQLKAAIGSTPALLLGGKVDIDKEFIVTEQGQSGGLTWLELKPREKNQYTGIRLGFAANVVKQMELRDNLGQTTRIKFDDELRNPSLDTKLFDFSPPPGVDVINAKDL